MLKILNKSFVFKKLIYDHKVMNNMNEKRNTSDPGMYLSDA